MNVELISDDCSLLAFCREVAREFPKVNWKLGIRSDSLERLNADLCLWDYKPGAYFPENAAWGTKCFALVESRHLTAFCESHPSAEAGIALKPLAYAVLRGLMAQTVRSCAEPRHDEADSVRSDRDELLQCLMHANRRLQQYDAERSNFLGRALHDFHAPLTALSGYCGFLLEDHGGSLSEQEKLIIQRMQHSVRRLSRMSRAMFQLSVGRHVSLKPTLRPGDIQECVEQALYEIQQLVQEKELQLDINLERPSVSLLFDPGQIEQVMINLLENACKFTPRTGTVAVKGYCSFVERRVRNVFCPPESERRVRDRKIPNAYRIDVVDSGPGISPEHLKSIFEEYVSYSGGQDRSRGGLGLAICRMILNQHDGRIWAENCKSGAVFSFILLLQRAECRHSSTAICLTEDIARSLAACV